MNAHAIGSSAASVAIGAIVLNGVWAFQMRSVPSEVFQQQLFDATDIRVIGHRIEAPERLPILITLRFPGYNADACSAIRNRTDVYTISAPVGIVDCRASVRDNHVCHVSFAGAGDAEPLRKFLNHSFPGLATE